MDTLTIENIPPEEKDFAIERFLSVVNGPDHILEAFNTFLLNWRLSLNDDQYITEFFNTCDNTVQFADVPSAIFDFVSEVIDNCCHKIDFYLFLLKVLVSITDFSLLNKVVLQNSDLLDILIDTLFHYKQIDEMQNLIKKWIIILSPSLMSSENLLLLLKHAPLNPDVMDILLSIFNYRNPAFHSLILNSENSLVFNDLQISNPMRNLTACVWIRLSQGTDNLSHSELDNISLLHIFADDDFELHFMIVDGRLVVNLDKENHCFESFIFELDTLYHVALVLEYNQEKKCQVQLYVNKNYIQSVLIPVRLGSGIGTKIPSKFNKPKDKLHLEVRLAGSKSISNVILEVYNILIINKTVEIVIIQLLFYLGPGYAGNFQDTNLLSLISSSSQTKLHIAINEENFAKSMLLISNLNASWIILSWKASPIIKEVDIIKYSTWSNKNLLQKQISGKTYKRPIIALVLDLFDCISGFSGLLALTKNCCTTESLVKMLKILFFVLENSRSTETEFVANNGYDILATIMKTKKEFITMDVLDVMLSFVGFNQTAPIQSIILNTLAYKTIIMDFNIWNVPEIEDNGCLKFLLFQFTIFGQESRYHHYNMKQISQMKIVQSILLTLKQRIYNVDNIPIVENILNVLVNCEPTVEVFRSLQLHVTFTRKRIELIKNSDFLSFIELENAANEAVLKVILNSICDKLIIKSHIDYAPLVKILNWKWILGCIGVSQKMNYVSLSILVNFLHVQPVGYYNDFVSIGGMSALLSILENSWDDININLLLILGSFGKSFTFKDFKSLDVFTRNNIRIIKANQITMPHFFIVLQGLMVFAAKSLTYNDETTKAVGALNNYSDYLLLSYEMLHFYSNNLQWMCGFLFLSTIIYLKKCEKLMKKFKIIHKTIIVEMLFSGATSDFELLKRVYLNSTIEFNLIIMPLIVDHIYSSQINMTEILKEYKRVNFFIEIITDYLGSWRNYTFDEISYIDLEKIGIILGRLTKTQNSTKIKSQLSKLANKFCITYLCYFTSSVERGFADGINFCCRVFLEFSTFFIKGVDYQNLLFLFAVMINALKSLKPTSLLASCIKTFLLNVDNIAELIRLNNFDFELFVYYLDLANKLLALDDTQIVNYTYDDEKYTELIAEQYESGKTRLKNLPFFADNTKNLELIIDNKSINEKGKKLIENEIKPFNQQLYNTELKKFNAHIQDYMDNVEHNIRFYNLMTFNVPFIEENFSFELSPIEGKYRQRNKLIKTLYVDQNLEEINNQSSYLKFPVTGISSEQLDFVTDLPDLDESYDEDKNRRIIRSLFVNDKIEEIYNVTQIIGLETIECIMIVGTLHIYFVDNYFYSSNHEILESFETPEDQKDAFVEILKNISGEIKVLKSDSVSRIHKTKSWPTCKLISISKRKFLLRDVAFEMFFDDGSSILLTCSDLNKRNSIYNRLNAKVSLKKIDADLNEALYLASQQKIQSNSLNEKFGSIKLMDSFIKNFSDNSLSDITKRWCNGEISNFYYLMLINTIAGRTFNDLTQYPVFPFVLNDYESLEIDLSDSTVYRDLSKPMGAQTYDREQQFRERYETIKELTPEDIPFHYGTHYSSAMIVASYMIRIRPFTEAYLKLQGGSFDHADRLFNSIPKLWSSATKNSTDIRELIPEFYYLPDFLVNKNSINLGKTQDGVHIDNVELPTWANGDPVKFMKTMREALESEHVSCHLHEWIDLIFGYKQQGKEAISAVNVFHKYSYPGSIDLEKINDEHERAVVTSIIHNFGQTPLKIFFRPHPAKSRQVVDLLDHFERTFKEEIKLFQADSQCVDELVYNLLKDDWIVLPTSFKLLVLNDGIKMKISIIGFNVIQIDDRFQFEGFTNGGYITAVYIISPGKFIAGFNNGTMRLFEISDNIFKKVTNFEKANALYENRYLRFSNDGRSIKGKIASNRRSQIFLSNFITFRTGHYKSIIKIKAIKADYVMITIDSSRKSLIFWDFSDNSSVRKIKEVIVKRTIIDFDVSEEHSEVYAITLDKRLMIWTINGMLVLDVELEKDAACITAIKRRGKGFFKGNWIGIGFRDERVEIYEVNIKGLRCIKSLIFKGLGEAKILEIVTISTGFKMAIIGSEKSFFVE
ncbi:Bph1 protein [Martiniozyma asiatica (nom. inval.)]|nr:Bph1 protein [Martiniozyma asiatica]